MRAWRRALSRVAAGSVSRASPRRAIRAPAAGNPRARKALVELAWLWLRHQPESALARRFHGRVGAAGGRVRRIAIVALARRLLVALWRYVETGVVPTEAQVKA